MQQVFLESKDLLKRISQALWKKEPFSLVRIGDGENLVLSQDTVWPISKVLEERWAIKASKGEKGLYLPNLPLRDAVAASIRNASVVGILPYNDSLIKAPDYLKRPLTDQVFRHFDLNPVLVCHAGINRELAEMQEFWRLLKQRRILIVTREAEQLRQRLEQPPYSLHIVKSLPFDHWGQYRETMDWITSHATSFDIALFSCGVNAVVLAERTMALTGRIALDFGKAANIVLKGRAN